MTNVKLQIQQQPCKETMSQQFALAGTIDIDASGVLEALYVLPSKATAELNFAQVEWINSMGLAQLIKLFDHWQKQDIKIRITRANQMICLLFNKTGLAHLLADGNVNHDAAGLHTVRTAPHQISDGEQSPHQAATLVEPPMLQIQPQPSTESLNQQLAFIGNIDVSAVQLLEPLYVLPRGCSVELNFSQVERVNSMGLAQLLKLFEHWQKQEIVIRVTHVNRMISVLFKMTGLSRFLSESPSPAAVAAPVNNNPAPPIQSTPVQPSPAQLTTASGLQIQPQPSAEIMVQRFTVTGVIDVDAMQLLATMYVLPPQCAVELDFGQVQRVNSMGLAQLLKLFEHWQKQHISIRISNPNRMVGVLFKMTGLNRFLTDTPLPTHSQPFAGTAAAPAIPQLAADTQPFSPKASGAALSNDTGFVERRSTSIPAASSGNKLELWVSAQSSQQMNGWYFFNTYLQRHLGREVHMELVHGAINERRKRIEEMDLVFTKPFEATRLMLEQKYRPLLRPIDQTDEVTLLVRADDPRQTLAEYQGGKIVTAAPDNFVYLLGRFLLEESESALANMEYLFSGHDIKALQMLLKGSADILFMLSDTYKGLSGLTKKNLRVIDQSETAFAFHLFSVSPQYDELGSALTDVLLNMTLDSQGRQVLADLGIPGWTKPTQDECDMLAMLYNRYAISQPAA